MILTLVSIGSGYSDKSDEMTDQINRFKNGGWDIKLLTDKPENFPLVKTYKYQNKIFSYFDKMLFPLRIMEETKRDVVYIDHDFLINMSDAFVNEFKGYDKFIYHENWQKWNDENKNWDPWKYFGDYHLDYFNPLIDYWKKQNYDYKKILTIRECFLYFPFMENVGEIIYEIEKIKPVFEYLSVIGESKFKGYGCSEGLALYTILEKYNIPMELFVDDYSKLKKP